MAVGWEELPSHDGVALSELWEVVSNYYWSFIFNTLPCLKYGI